MSPEDGGTDRFEPFVRGGYSTDHGYAFEQRLSLLV
jgi:hypothetical protein